MKNWKVLRLFLLIGSFGSSIVILSLKFWEKSQQTPKKGQPEKERSGESKTTFTTNNVLVDTNLKSLQEQTSADVEILDSIQTLEADLNKNTSNENTTSENLNLNPENPPVLDPFTEDQAGSSETWSPSAMF